MVQVDCGTRFSLEFLGQHKLFGLVHFSPTSLFD